MDALRAVTDSIPLSFTQLPTSCIVLIPQPDLLNELNFLSHTNHWLLLAYQLQYSKASGNSLMVVIRDIALTIIHRTEFRGCCLNQGDANSRRHYLPRHQ